MADDIGIPLRAGTQLVVQVHYNLLAGTGPDPQHRAPATVGGQGVRPAAARRRC